MALTIINKHSHYVAERVSSRNNTLKAFEGTSWGQQKETLLMTYKAIRRSIINYSTPVCSPNLHGANYRKNKTQNEALRIATGCHKMSSINHLHTEAKSKGTLRSTGIHNIQEPHIHTTTIQIRSSTRRRPLTHTLQHLHFRHPTTTRLCTTDHIRG